MRKQANRGRKDQRRGNHSTGEGEGTLSQAGRNSGAVCFYRKTEDCFYRKTETVSTGSQ